MFPPGLMKRKKTELGEIARNRHEKTVQTMYLGQAFAVRG